MFITVWTPSSRRTGPDVPHRRMHQRREHEDDARFRERARHDLDRRLDRDAERLEHVGAAALRRERAVAVLGDAHARARDEQRRGGRDVEGVDRSAAGAAGVDQIVAARSAGSSTIALSERPDDGGELRRRSRPSREGR